MTDGYNRAPIDVPEQAQVRETVIYGPRGEALIVREPRRIGFRIEGRPRGLGGDDGHEGSGRPPMRGE